MLRYVRRRLGIEAQDDRINYSLKEIETLKTHITRMQKQEPKVIKQTIYQKPKNDPLLKEINLIKSRESKTHKIISDYKDTFLEFVDVVSGKLDDFNDRLDDFEDKLATSNQNRNRPTFNQMADRTTKQIPKIVTGRPTQTTKRSTSMVSTTDQIEAGQTLWINATDAEKEIIRTLYDAGYPVSYSELAKKLGKSLSTVKNHLNNMKSKGFQFQERTGLNNSKKYLLDTRVKTFLTLRLND